jgi:sulfonate transport system substrate-binding protein
MFRKLIVTAIALAGLGGLFATTTAQAGELRIGYQKYGTLVILKEKGSLEEKLKPLGYTVTWTEFPGGPQLLEALNVGAIDFGTVGEAPPIFAQAAGAPFLYVGYEPPAPTGEAILVPKDSPIKSVADLKGKKVALNKGSNVHYFLVKALEAGGVAYKDIQPTFLTPADARAAFESGSVDAWAIWDPFYAAGQAATGARTLVDGSGSDGKGLVSNHQFFLAERKFTTDNPQVIDTTLDALKEIDAWASQHPDEVAKDLSPKTGIPVDVLKVAIGRLGFGLRPIDDAVVAEQQKIADTFLQLGLLPKAITVSDAVRKPGA